MQTHSKGNKSISNVVVTVWKITQVFFSFLKEMQQVAPPLTGIHTPNKAGNSVFAFGHRNITHESSVPLIGTSKRKPSGMRS